MSYRILFSHFTVFMTSPTWLPLCVWWFLYRVDVSFPWKRVDRGEQTDEEQFQGPAKRGLLPSVRRVHPFADGARNPVPHGQIEGHSRGRAQGPHRCCPQPDQFCTHQHWINEQFFTQFYSTWSIAILVLHLKKISRELNHINHQTNWYDMILVDFIHFLDSKCIQVIIELNVNSIQLIKFN